MKIKNVQVHHVGCIKEVDWNLEGHHLFAVGGRNGSGKTTALRMITMLLCGRSGMDDYWEVPLDSAVEEGSVKIALTGDREMHDDIGFEAELCFERRPDGSIKETLKVTDSAGDPAPEPQKTLQRLYGPSLDPTKFDRMGSAEQVKMLQTRFPGIDCSELDKEKQKVYADRRDLNRDIKQQEARLAAIEIPEDVPDVFVSVAELMQQQGDLRKKNEENAQARQALQDERYKIADAQRKADEQVVRMENAKEKVAEIERLLAEAKRRVGDCERVHEELCKNVVNMHAAYEKQAAQVEQLKDHDLTDIEQQIVDSEGVNELVRRKHKKAELQEALKADRKKANAMTQRLTAIDGEKRRKLQEAKFPIDGMTVSKHGIFVDGRPLNQVQQSRRIKIWLRIAIELNPKLRAVVFEHGSDLDWETFDDIAEMCREHDCQAIVEVATRTKEDDNRCQIIMENGESLEITAS